MAVPMHPATPGAKVYPSDRSVNPKLSSTMAASTQHAPSRPSSAAPNLKADTDRAKSPLAAEGLNVPESQGSSGNDVFRGSPNAGVALDQFNAMNQMTRVPPGANSNQGYMPHPFFNPAMGVASQQGYAPSAQMSFYPPNFAQNMPYGAHAANSTRPATAHPKFQTADSKFPQNQLAQSNAPQQLQNNMIRRQSSYFVPAPMSPVQNIAPRGWIPSNPTMLPGPMAMQNGTGSMQNPAMYQPALMATSANPAMLTPPGNVQSAYPPAYTAGTVSPAGFGYPTPPEAVISPDIPPPVPSVYPDPAYSNINNCIYNPKGTTNVYIRGLRPETTDEDLLHMVRQYGNIVSTKAIIDTQTKSCKGFGFAKFESVDSGVACIVALSQVGYQCSFAKESFSNRLKDLSEPTNTNLYISNLPLDIDEQRLDELLKPHRVHSSRILRDQTRASRGVGFARMTDRESADAVIEQWNGKTYPGSDVPLQVRFADTPMQKKLKSVTARRRSWRAKEYNSLTQGRPLSPETQRYYEEQFGQGHPDYPAAQLYANGGTWQQDAFYPIESSFELHAGQTH